MHPRMAINRLRVRESEYLLLLSNRRNDKLSGLLTYLPFITPAADCNTVRYVHVRASFDEMRVQRLVGW